MASQPYIVVDIGGTKIRYGLFINQQLSEIEELPTPQVSTKAFIKTLVQAFTPLMEKHEVAGVGVASAGPIDFERGEIRNPTNLGNGDESWRHFAIENDLKEQLNIPVKVDNDAALTALGFYKNYENEGHKDIVLLTLGTGLGVGAIVGGESVRAGQSMHPELGHFIVADQPGDYDTPFDGFPTLESYLSGKHFALRVGKKMGRELSGAELLSLSTEGGELIASLWEEYAQRMAVALTNLYLAYFPQKIVLAGGFSNAAKDFYYERSIYWFHRLMQKRVEAGMAVPDVLISANCDDLPLLGAGELIHQFLFQKKTS